MSQVKVSKLVSKLRYEVKPRRRFSNPEGPEGRLKKIRHIVTALIKHERIELNYFLGDESRGYAERLISDAIRYGEKHKTTMEMATYWLEEKQLVHKLFKVLVPRYQDCKLSYTMMWKAPTLYPDFSYRRCVLELRDNIYPKLVPEETSNHLLLHNVLLDYARRDYNSKLYREHDPSSEKIELYQPNELDDWKVLADWKWGSLSNDNENKNENINTEVNNLSEVYSNEGANKGSDDCKPDIDGKK